MKTSYLIAGITNPLSMKKLLLIPLLALSLAGCQPTQMVVAPENAPSYGESSSIETLAPYVQDGRYIQVFEDKARGNVCYALNGSYGTGGVALSCLSGSL